ncbi:MAG: hypothetical protein RQ745_07820 [Longimicrobiales bacterium]|nr:hypothetical protein [Longimicrobiales bacterium]
MIRKGDQLLSTLEQWEKYAEPKRAVQWQDYRSAKECARRWLERDDPARIPVELERILTAHPDFGVIREWEAEPEALVAFDEYDGPANIDVLVSARDDTGAFTMAIEAKADETFGPLVERALSDALERRLENPRSRGLARVEELAERLLGPVKKGQPRLHTIRYQLMTATAAALAEANRRGASRAVVMVHEFDTPRTEPEKHKKNARDLVRYLKRLDVEDAERVLEGELAGPIEVSGGTEIGRGVPLYVGKATTPIAMRARRSITTSSSGPTESIACPEPPTLTQP